MSDNLSHAGRRQSVSLACVIYNLLLALLFPLLLLYLGYRLLRGKSRAGLRERLGILPDHVREYGESEDTVVWIHAASVGEVNAVTPILRELRLRLPLAHMVLSVITPTGRQIAEKRDLGVDAVIYFPFDLPLIVERFLHRLNPAVFVMVETELWPNLLAACRRHGVTTVVVNGRISDRAYPKTRALWPLYRWMLRNVDLVCAQSELDAERFRALGAPAERVVVAGNSKFDDTPAHVSAAESARWRQEFGFGEDDFVLVAGSTHEGEEEIVLDVFDHLRFSHRDLQLVIAPRHPERGDRVHELVREHGYDVYRRSHALAARAEDQEPGPRPTGPTVRVAILDTVGELVPVYGCADLVLVGGSLLRGLSGHNVLEPIAQGKPTLFGPYMADFRDISAIALREGCAVQVTDAAALQAECERLLASESDREALAGRGRAMIAKYAGASARYAEAVERLLAARAPQQPLGAGDRDARETEA
ncbi:MAG: 3-deoxy-D-manno-octulosonic acid transferase [Armatimonadetes bacterium]|nr:3-deoxy-D-manno-octulosonic acid transferase [Armatimonadota bacterium]